MELKEKGLKKLKTTVEQFKADADKFSYAAKKKTSLVNIMATISKANVMKRAASENYEILEKLQNKKQIMEMKSEL